MFSSHTNLRKQFLIYLNQPDSCELFYNYMKSEDLSYVLEFYLACDGLKNLLDDNKNQRTIIELIYKHYLSNDKSLSSSTKFSLPNHLLYSIKQRLIKHEYHVKFYDQAQEYVLKYMLQMCYPKFLIEQQNLTKSKRQALNLPTFTPMHRRCMSIRKKDIFDKLKQQSDNAITPIKMSYHHHPINLSSLEGSTLITDNQNRLLKTNQCNLAQRNPAAFFEEIKSRLIAYQTEIINDDSVTILDIQIAKTIDDADNYLFDYRNQSNHFTRYDSGIGTDSSEKNYQSLSSQKQRSFIDVIWYPSLDSHNALLSTIPRLHNQLTFKDFRQLFRKQTAFRYFFKTICTPDINKEQYVFRELTMDDELVPYYHGKIFVQLDSMS